jgi:hypothetical protein
MGSLVRSSDHVVRFHTLPQRWYRLMAQSPGFAVTLQDASAAVPPNTVALVGTNDEADIKPSQFSATDWQYSLFASWSGGCFVPGWGSHGAYIACGTGGHAVPENPDGALFDFADYTWKRITNTNGLAPRVAGYSTGETNGSPWYEVNGVSQVPAPAHTYKHYIGVGDTVFRTCGGFILNSAIHSSRCHKFDLNGPALTGTWSRGATNDTYTAFPGFATFGGIDYSEAFHDVGRNRIWLFPTMTHWVDSIPYLNLATSTWSGASVPNLTGEAPLAGLLYDTAGDRVFKFTSSGISTLLLTAETGCITATMTMRATSCGGSIRPRVRFRLST